MVKDNISSFCQNVKPFYLIYLFLKEISFIEILKLNFISNREKNVFVYLFQ